MHFHEEENSVQDSGFQTRYSDCRRPRVRRDPSFTSERGSSFDNNRRYSRKRKPSGRFDNEPKRFKHEHQNGSSLQEVRGGRCKFGYRRLEALSQEDPSEILVTFTCNNADFQMLLKMNLKPDWIILIMRLLAKVCEVEFEVSKVAILSHACCVEFLDHLKDFVVSLSMRQDYACKQLIDNFLTDILKFCRTVLTCLPQTACDRLEVIVVTCTISADGIQQFQHISVDDQIKADFLSLHSSMKLFKEEKREQKKKSSMVQIMGAQEPPDNFRELDVFPSQDDIFSAKPAFIRPNIVHGAYTNVDQYLDIQFRLLREDFVGPLREGICEFIEQLTRDKRKSRKINNIKFYKNIKILESQISKGRLVYTVLFDREQKLKNVQWEYSKRLMYGSLLCFTQDNFETLLFGMVVDRNTFDLRKGEVVVELYKVDELVPECDTFTMVESDVYFEPYRHVLNALQTMDDTNFPMERYIIRIQSDISPPKYLRNNPSGYMIGHHIVPALDTAQWPNARQLRLDDSQYCAFVAALTEEFVVIQGPPGSGKTFIGLKVCEVILKNVSLWRTKTEQQPIFVVCYTNHALDQFLEGLTKFTQDLVRIGGQSRNPVLNDYNLKEKRKQDRARNYSTDLRALKCTLRNQSDKLASMKTIIEKLDNNAGIISLNILSKFEVINNDNQICLMDNGRSFLVEWLYDTEWDTDENFDLDPATVLVRINSDSSGQRYVSRSSSNVEHEQTNPSCSCENQYYNGDEIEMNRMVEDALFEFPSDPRNEKRSNFCHVEFDLTLDDLSGEIKQMQGEIQSVLHKMCANNVADSHKLILEERMCRLQHKHRYFKHMLSKSFAANENAVRNLTAQNDLWGCSYYRRWTLYNYWILKLKEKLPVEMRKLEKEYQNEWKKYGEMLQIEDLNIVKECQVLGMTTTCAAKLQKLLQALKPKIVIVEEAAEVLESHIVASLTSHCQHLILIGDHQQLRPSTAVYKLAKDFNFDISLFERMIKNGMTYNQLNVQHRMRPQIAELIVPAIYPNLKNHESVQTFEDILGITKNVFFINHEYPEDDMSDSQSHLNRHEAEFLIALCKHLVLQGYEPSRITILTAYSGQMFLFKKLRRNHSLLAQVRVTVLDNFQGEENDIILLSLVRSNNEGKIGFLKADNRVCVALSRARKGFYMMGNMKILVNGSELWSNVNATLESQNAIGPHLTLTCQNHPSVCTKVANAEDFASNSPEGGCLEICKVELPCGHRCRWVCHVLNANHENYVCRERCERKCELKHKCKKRCYEDCGKCMVPVDRVLPCKHKKTLLCHVDPNAYRCLVEVEKVIPHCQHKVLMECSADLENFKCPVPCEFRVPCGHSCKKKCHVLSDPDHLEYKCRSPCTQKNQDCSQNHICKHRCWVTCSKCFYEVEKILPCGHPAKVKCSTSPEEVTCHVAMKKVIESCGHSVKLECSEQATQDRCKNKCKKLLPCGHKCKSLCKDQCTEKCRELVQSPVLAACGHTVKIFCYEAKNQALQPDSEMLLAHCKEPCQNFLLCGHRCQGTCGECLQGRIHQPCKEKCGRVLICGHTCNIPCGKICPPCNKNCEYRCKHVLRSYKCKRGNCKQPSPCVHEYKTSRCPKRCGQQCVECKEKCQWKCAHYECTSLCSEMCNRPPCNKPCKKKLKGCPHPCIGFCGEPCPPLCRICDKIELTEEFFLLGNEGEEDSRFVYLEDCGHTIEAEGLEMWLNRTEEGDMEINMKTCPRCKTTITRNFRFGNIIKSLYADFHQIKRKILGSADENLRKQEILESMIADMQNGGATDVQEKVADQIILELLGLGTKSPIDDSVRLQTLQNKCNIVLDTYNLIRHSNHALMSRLQTQLSDHVDKLLKNMNHRDPFISEQEYEDFRRELSRLERIRQLFVMESNPSFSQLCTADPVKSLHENCKKEIFTIERYMQDNDEKVQTLITDLAENIQDLEVEMLQRERKMVAEVMGKSIGKGRWFKCPNGHYYVIGECGGAMQQSHCIECNAQIGGSNHRLLPTNSFAGPEMDGSANPAWPGMH